MNAIQFIGEGMTILIALLSAFAFGENQGHKSGYEAGLRDWDIFYDHVNACNNLTKRERDMYREIANQLCKSEESCDYCPLNTVKHDKLCKLWELDEKVGT